MQDREEPSQHIFTVTGCGMAEFNGKYFLDTDRMNGYENGKRCYRKDGVGDTGSECTIFYGGYGWWAMTKDYDPPCYYSVESRADQPLTSGWTATFGSGSPPKLVYGGSDVPNFYVILDG